MEKLIKTAKQQFEERLNELTILDQETTEGNYTYYLCKDNDSRCIILEEGEGVYNIYSEIRFAGTIIDAYKDEDFLATLVDYWIEYRHEPLKQLFEWYSSADIDNPPFSIQTLAQCSHNVLLVEFSDLYEDVPDMRIITAKEQWERDSKNAKVAATLDNGSIYKVEVTEQSITFYVFKGDCYTKSIFPPFSELRKDNKFIIKYLELVRMSHDGDMDYALSWLAGGEYKMSELSLLDIYESSQEIDGMEYEDKELFQEQTIEEMITLTPEQKKAIEIIEEGFDMLSKNGGTIVTYTEDHSFYAINTKGLELRTTNYEDDLLKERGFFEISDIVEENQIYFDVAEWAMDGCMYAKPL